MPRQDRGGRAVNDLARNEAGPHRSFPQLAQQRAKHRREARRKQGPADRLVQDDHCRRSVLSVFKIIRKSDYLKSPRDSARGLNLAKTLGSRRHKALIAILIERREAAGMTQTQLADRLGEYQSFVARLESGQRRVDV